MEDAEPAEPTDPNPEIEVEITDAEARRPGELRHDPIPNIDHEKWEVPSLPVPDDPLEV